MRIGLGLLLVLPLSGCLKTRSEMKETETRQVIQQQVVGLQKNTADINNRFAEIEENIRGLNGRTEVLENRIAVTGQDSEKDKKSLAEQNAELQRRVALLQETLGKMETQVNQLSAEVSAMKADKSTAAAHEVEKAQAKKTPYDVAEESFSQKDWKKAILNYEKYRQDSPKGKYVPDATYKIGVAFQELKMGDEAKTFYEEVISKYPKTEEARRAKTRLKSLKK